MERFPVFMVAIINLVYFLTTGLMYVMTPAEQLQKTLIFRQPAFCMVTLIVGQAIGMILLQIVFSRKAKVVRIRH